MAELRDVLAGQIVIADVLPTEGECAGDPFVLDLDDHHYQGTVGFLPRYYVRYPMAGDLVPMVADVVKASAFASNIVVHGRKVIFVSSHPVPRAMCAARTIQLTFGGTIQGAMLQVNRADDRAFGDDRVLQVMLALGGGSQ